MVSKGVRGIDMFNNLNIKGTKKWRKKPDECAHCKSKTVTGIEILCAYEGALFWECDDCGERMLRFTKQTTVKHLRKTEDLFIDLEGMENICQQPPN